MYVKVYFFTTTSLSKTSFLTHFVLISREVRHFFSTFDSFIYFEKTVIIPGKVRICFKIIIRSSIMLKTQKRRLLLFSNMIFACYVLFLLARKTNSFCVQLSKLVMASKNIIGPKRCNCKTPHEQSHGLGIEGWSVTVASPL